MMHTKARQHRRWYVPGPPYTAREIQYLLPAAAVDAVVADAAAAAVAPVVVGMVGGVQLPWLLVQQQQG